MSDSRHAPDTIFEQRGNKLWLANPWDYDLAGDEPLEIPSHFEVCDVCNGTGSHVNPSIDAHGLSAEDFAADPDFAEDYHAGHYDVTCYACGGRRVSLVPNDEQAPEIQAVLKADAEHRQEMAHERSMRARGIEW